MADKQKGETATVLMAEARASLVSGDLDDAVGKLRLVTQLAPESSAGYLSLGDAPAGRGDFVAAAESYSEALKPGAAPRAVLAGSGNGLRKNSVLVAALEAEFEPDFGARTKMRVSADRDEAATGAALCAAVACGTFESISAASRSFVRYES